MQALIGDFVWIVFSNDHKLCMVNMGAHCFNDLGIRRNNCLFYFSILEFFMNFFFDICRKNYTHQKGWEKAWKNYEFNKRFLGLLIIFRGE